MESNLEKQILNATQVIEEQLDSEINRLEKLDEEDFEALKARRLAALKKQGEQRQHWLTLGHGQYSEIADEKEFFSASKKSKFVVCHFYRDSTFRCKIVDKHLALLAPKHIETKFIKIDAEKSQFLCERLHVKVLPSICLIKDAKIVDIIIGFDDLGGRDEFPTERLEWRIACAKVINYDGDLSAPPDEKKVKKAIFGYDKFKPIHKDDDSDDD